jgi:hypothetical protein
MPHDFKNAWLTELQQQDYGWFENHEGKRHLIQLSIQNSDSYLTNGRFICAAFDLLVPTKVFLDYQIEDNLFKLTIIKNEEDDDLHENEYNENDT